VGDVARHSNRRIEEPKIPADVLPQQSSIEVSESS
jgi:hypothetical protein